MVGSEFGKLTRVLVHEPGFELDHVDEPGKWLFHEKPFLSAAQDQHRAFCDALSVNGAKVVDVGKTDAAVPNLYFTRDHGLMLENGFLPANVNAVRQPEMPAVLAAFKALDVPVLESPLTDSWEGGDVLWWNEDTLILGQSVRTRVSPNDFAKATGKRVVPVTVPERFIHLDLIFSLLNREFALSSTRFLPDDFKAFLRLEGVDVVAANDLRLDYSCANVVMLDEKTLVAPKGLLGLTNQRLSEAGFDVLEVNLSELLKGGGGPRCMTLPLSRQRI